MMAPGYLWRLTGKTDCGPCISRSSRKSLDAYFGTEDNIIQLWIMDSLNTSYNIKHSCAAW